MIYSFYDGKAQDDWGQEQWAEASFWHSIHDIEDSIKQYGVEAVLNALSKDVLNEVQYAFTSRCKTTGVRSCSLLEPRPSSN